MVPGYERLPWSPRLPVMPHPTCRVHLSVLFTASSELEWFESGQSEHGCPLADRLAEDHSQRP